MPGHHPARSRRATERKSDVRERAILDTCEALPAHKGYDAMTVGDIAQGAGITRGALYFCFGSKQEAVTALVARTVHASQNSRAELQEASSTCEHVWLISAGLIT
ncbi:TetR/AcrR family transcriptional regulator [Streptomyces chrestomyceticus]|uniref:TetR/AcrR family transcriptional regulator n=1 Tax=Streptomyces chrestomyceticus TaxID=68185 RepID=UPI0033DFC591